MTKPPFALSLWRKGGLRQAQPERVLRALFALFALTALIACAPFNSPAATGPVFPELTGRVVDEADLLAPEEERRLAAASEALERETGPQYVIATINSLQGYSIEDYGMGLGNHWGVGHQDRNDGLLMIVAPNERKVRIEVGYGLEHRITNSFAAEVIEEDILPHFRDGAFPAGIIAGSERLVARLRLQRQDEETAVEDRITA